MNKLKSHVSVFPLKCIFLYKSEKFYDHLFKHLHLERKDTQENMISYWSDFGIILQQQDQFLVDVEHYLKVGVFQISVNVSTKEAVDTIYQEMKKGGFKIYWEPKIFDYAPGYYSTCIHDPDDTLIEVVFIP